MQPSSASQDFPEEAALLARLLDHARLSSSHVSQLASTKGSFGLAWLVCDSLKKRGAALTFQSLDLSKCKACPAKLRLLLRSVPGCVDEMTFGPSFFEGDKLPLICRFLQGDEGWTGEGEKPLLRRLSLAECRLNDEKATLLFPSLPLSLEKLVVSKNLSLSNAGWVLLGQHLAGLQGLKELTISSCHFGERGGNALFSSLPVSLESLDLHDSPGIEDSGWGTLHERLKSLTCLRELNLSGCALTDWRVERVATSLPSSIEKLNLGSNRGIHDAGWMALGQRVKDLARLRALNLFCCVLSKENLQPLLSSLPRSIEILVLSHNAGIALPDWKALALRLPVLDRLRDLDLYNCNLDDERAEVLFPALPSLLESLKVHLNVRLSPGGWGVLGVRLRTLRRLKFLTLMHCCLNDEKAERFFGSLPLSLEHLDLSYNAPVGTEGWVLLAERVKSLEGLKELNVARCELNDKRPIPLFESLPVSIEKLNLSYSPTITNAGWEALTKQKLGSLERLKELEMIDCGLTDDKAVPLFSSLPMSVEFLNFSGNHDILADGWASLGGRLVCLNSLRELRLYYCDLTREKLDLFVPSLPFSLETFSVDTCTTELTEELKEQRPSLKLTVEDTNLW